MASFGEFEAVEEIESDGYTTVFRARKAGSTTAFAVKLFNVTRHLPSTVTTDTTHRPAEEPHDLGKALELDFLEAVKLQRRTAEAGATNVVPVHEFGMDERGAWFATDFYSRGTLRNFLRLKGGANAEELTWIVHGVLQGLLALRATGGRTHGQLQASKIFLSGRPRTSLRQKRILISDPAPGPPNAAECELADLRALGQLIYELVHRREIEAEEAPFLVGTPSEDWVRLGEKAGFWRDLSKELLHPGLSLENTSIEKLAAKIRPRRSVLVPVLAGGVTAALVAGGIVLWILHDPGPRLAKVENIELWEGEIKTLSIKVRPGKGLGPLIFETPPTDANGRVKVEAVTAGPQVTNVVLRAGTNRTGQARQAKLLLRVTAGSKSNERTVTVTVKSRDTPPVILGELPDRMNRVNGDPVKIPIAVSERETPRKVKLTATSTDSQLLPNLSKSVAPEGNGTNWFLTISPAQDRAGRALVTLEATDGMLKTNRQFWVEFTNSPPTIELVDKSPLKITNGVRATRGLLVRVKDQETSPDKLRLTAANSTDPRLVPADKNHVRISEKGSERTVEIVPISGQTGSTEITLNVTDGITNSTATLSVTVVPRNTAPSIEPLANVEVTQGDAVRPVPLVVRDAETDNPAKLQIWAASSDPGLVSDRNIVTSFVESKWELSIRPATNRTGSVRITVFVSDSDLTSSNSFQFTVKPKRVTAPPPSLAFARLSNVVTNMNWPLDQIPVQLIANNFGIGEPAGVKLEAQSDNPSIISTSQIKSTGSGTNWILYLTPRINQTGTARVTLTARLNSLPRPVTTDFQLTINNRRPEFVTFSPTSVSATTGTTAGPVAVVINDDGPPGTLRIWTNRPATMAMTVDVQQDRTNSYSWNVWVRGTNQTPQRIEFFVFDGQLTNTNSFFVTFTNRPAQIPRSLAIVDLPTDTVMTNMNSEIGPIGFQLQAKGFTPNGEPRVRAIDYDTNLIAEITARRVVSATNYWSVSVRPQPYIIGERRVSVFAEWDGTRATSFFRVSFTNRPPYFASLSATSVTARVGEWTPPITVRVDDPDTVTNFLYVSADPASAVRTNQIIISGEGANRGVQVISTNLLDHVRVSLVVSDGRSLAMTNFLVTFITPVVLAGASNQTNGVGVQSKAEGGTQAENTLRRLQILQKENKAAEAIDELYKLPLEIRSGPGLLEINNWATNVLVRSSSFASLEVLFGTLPPGPDIVYSDTKKQIKPLDTAVGRDCLQSFLSSLIPLKGDPKLHWILKERIPALTNAIGRKIEQSAK